MFFDCNRSAVETTPYWIKLFHKTRIRLIVRNGNVLTIEAIELANEICLWLLQLSPCDLREIRLLSGCVIYCLISNSLASSFITPLSLPSWGYSDKPNGQFFSIRKFEVYLFVSQSGVCQNSCPQQVIVR